MATNPYISNAAAIAALNAVVDLVDAGAGAGTLRIYSGTPPADADAALAGNTLLAQLTMSDPAFGAASDGTGEATVSASAISDDTSADNTGTASFFRLLDSDTNVVFQGTCGTADADLILDSVAISAGVTVSVSALTITLPENGI